MSGSSDVNYAGSYPPNVGGVGMPCAAWSAASFASNGQLWLFGGATTSKFHIRLKGLLSILIYACFRFNK